MPQHLLPEQIDPNIPEADGSMVEGIDPTALAIAEMLGQDLSGFESAEEASAAMIDLVQQMAEALQGEDEEDPEEEQQQVPQQQMPQQQAIAASFSPLMLSTIAENRVMKIDKLLSEGFISRPAAKRLADRWCNDNSISLALSSDDEDGFEYDLETYRSNGKLVNLGSQTGSQNRFQVLAHGEQLALSSDEIRDPKRNPLLADAIGRSR